MKSLGVTLMYRRSSRNQAYLINNTIIISQSHMELQILEIYIDNRNYTNWQLINNDSLTLPTRRDTTVMVLLQTSLINTAK